MASLTKRSATASRKALGGFLISGLLLALPGGILPAWGYHLRPHFLAIGNYFLFVNVGLLVSFALGRSLLKGKTVSATMAAGCFTAALSLLLLALVSPPTSEWWRLPGFLGIGIAAGILHMAVFQSVSEAYRDSPVLTVNLAGTIFGIGSALAVLFVALGFPVYSAESMLLLVAALPSLAGVWFATHRLPQSVAPEDRALTNIRRELTSVRAILFSALLFFHFGNEWAISGWLPLFLIQRLGISPASALLLLALYWMALVLGRLLTQLILSLVSHGRLLAGSVLASIFGCVLLAFTNNLFGAILGVLLIGLGFAPVYPLVVEKIGAGFPSYQPGLFNGIFSLALTGGLLVPALLGYAAEVFGLRAVVILPMIGSVIVFILLLLIWIEGKLSGGSPSAQL